ncbi:MAG: hypothetical protein ACLSBH_19925 [Coprobacillus cateniformis]
MLKNLIYTLLQQPLTNVDGGFWGFVIYTLIGHILWLFGVHGTMVTYAAMAPIYNAMAMANLSAFAAGTACPYPEWNFLCYYTYWRSGVNIGIKSVDVNQSKVITI